MKKIATVLLSSALLLSSPTFSLQAEASTLNQLVPAPISDSINEEIETYGAKPPKSNAPIHNISTSAVFFSYTSWRI